MIPKKLIKKRRLQNKRKTKRKEEGNIKDMLKKENHWIKEERKEAEAKVV